LPPTVATTSIDCGCPTSRRQANSSPVLVEHRIRGRLPRCAEPGRRGQGPNSATAATRSADQRLHRDGVVDVVPIERRGRPSGRLFVWFSTAIGIRGSVRKRRSVRSARSGRHLAALLAWSCVPPRSWSSCLPPRSRAASADDPIRQPRLPPNHRPNRILSLPGYSGKGVAAAPLTPVGKNSAETDPLCSIACLSAAKTRFGVAIDPLR